MKTELRPIGTSDLLTSTVSLGCWPMAGITSLDVDTKNSLATIQAALEAGINHFDTAFSYGYDGESDRLLKQALGAQFDSVIVATKVGTHFDPNRKLVRDARPERLDFEVNAIRKRLDRDRLDLLYLHAPDGVTEIQKSAEALAGMVAKGIVRYVGLSNASLDETYRFASVIKPIVLQPPFNMLQPETLAGLRPYIDEHACGVASYWPLMKGLLAGAMQRDHVLAENDKRRTYPIFQGEAWHRAQDLLDVLRGMAQELNLTVPQLVVHWTLRQRGVTSVLCGAKRPTQILESASAMNIWLGDEQLLQIEQAIERSRADQK
jgi:aryl-alcohol dehydrogenase-like predicted oxidoreductase